jgi:N-acetylmuramoyl-L-alanine amidase
LAKVLIDPGHGDRHSGNKWIDPGAVATHGGTTYKEKDMTLSFSKAVGAELTKLGHEVSYTRTGDVDDASLTKLDWRTDMANEANPDLFMSVHIDAAGSSKASGLSVYSNKKGESFKTAIEGAVTATPVRKPASKSLHITREVKDSPSLLLEAGFITNQNDVNAITGPNLAKEVAAGVDKGLKQNAPNE